MNIFNKKEYKYKLAYVCTPNHKEHFIQIALKNRYDGKKTVRTFKYTSSVRRFLEKFPVSRYDVRKINEMMDIAHCWRNAGDE